jgi:hypothetical protein
MRGKVEGCLSGVMWNWVGNKEIKKRSANDDEGDGWKKLAKEKKSGGRMWAFFYSPQRKKGNGGGMNFV